LVKKLRLKSEGAKDRHLAQKLSIQKKQEEHKTPPKKDKGTRNLRKRQKPAVRDASSISSQVESDESFSVSGKKRKRKNSDQINILLKHFKKNPKWDKETVDNAAQESGLSRSQAYKWGWDRKKRADEEGFEKPSKDEFGGYSKHDFTDNQAPISNLVDIDLNEITQNLLDT